MPGHIVMVVLGAVVAAAPPHSAHAHLPLSRHVAAASSFGAPPRGAVARRHRAAVRHHRAVVRHHRAAIRHHRAAVRHHRAALQHRAVVRRPEARSAADPAVTIADFRFTPPTTTVHVGDTITWTNDGPSSHTATARDGSFDTGTLSKGRSASHTFTRPGTYAYVCTIHPFMHGTITVLAAATTAPAPSTTTPAPATAATTSSSSTVTTPTPATPARAATAKPTLPVTGMDVIGAIAAGAVLLGCGLVLRRAVAA